MFSPDSVVSFKNVSKTYDGKTFVVRNLNLELKKGEFLTLLGPSGSGKTTTLMLIAGFEHPTTGLIQMGGKVINDLPPSRRNIGIVFQNYALFPHMTIAENVAFPLQVRRVSKPEIQERVSAALVKVQLTGFAERKPSQLSGGQQQRVALARALVFNPSLVLMDEPLGALDRRLREVMQLEIRSLHAALGTTFVYVTHDQSEALTMSDRIAVFHEGAVQQLATPTDIYENPRNGFVARFVGESNQFPAILRGTEDGCAIVETPDGVLKGRHFLADEAGGDQVLVSIRPENISFDGNAGDDNCIGAKVIDRIFHGDHVQLSLETASGIKFVGRSSAELGLQQDDDVVVRIRKEKCIIFSQK
ncbi:ABC transporter ATP-binding protein [Mesorhizobium amorphae]|uniref:ABC transporter ATP-binding protein n=1 Tax=Mesorhizobium amorphae TaxID=71433 RepID=UPI0017868FE4|nr:ABC transporter ATP-binding protein [Mesorhizobium amorphae]